MTRCALFMADGFETCEALITLDMLRRGGVDTDMISMNETLEVTSSHNVHVKAEKLYNGISAKDYDVLILPGGKKGTANLEACEPLKEDVRKHLESGRLTCALCAAPSILGHMGLLEGRNYTCFPDFDGEYGGSYQMELAVTDGNLITGRGMGATIEFARQILMAVADEETLKKVERGMQYEHAFREL
ncbi:MAG TPA: DJ-1 family protein [Erysipelotrichaceae bacterium]|nr:DJ-1 family protein [Erysipelotrichaceae bacterium]